MKRISICVASVLFSALLMLFACSCTEEEHGFVVPAPDNGNSNQDNKENTEMSDKIRALIK